MNQKISIVIPAYNASNYLAEAIDSALAQTYPNVEIIVVNDGSKDDGATERVALSYGNKIRYFFKENGGSSSALNFGIAHMTGEWFSWLSHDDLYVPEKLEKQIKYMESLKLTEAELKKHIFFSASDLIDAEGNIVRACNMHRAWKLADRIHSFVHNGYLIAEPSVYNFHGCSCLVHKDSLASVGFFNEHLRLLNDWDIWFRLYSAEYKVHYIPEPLVQGRVHAEQISRSIGFSYHNPEQDMFWKRSLDWLLDNHSEEEDLFFRFGRNAYLKDRNIDGDLAFGYTRMNCISKHFFKNIYRFRAFGKKFLREVYLKIKM